MRLPISQLMAEHRNSVHGYAHTFTYDPAGNRLVKNEGNLLTTYTYDVANQLVTSVDSIGTSTYTFDLNGNRQLIAHPDSTRTTYVYDYEDRTTVFAAVDAPLTTYTYNADRQRVQPEQGSETTNYLWDSERYLQINSTSADDLLLTVEPTTYGEMISHHDGSGQVRYHADALGSTRNLTDSSAIILESQHDTAPGELLLTNSGTTPFLWIGSLGYEHEQAIYVRARVYNALINRWTSEDPLWPNVDDNPYVYTSNAPTLWRDAPGTQHDGRELVVPGHVKTIITSDTTATDFQNWIRIPRALTGNIHNNVPSIQAVALHLAANVRATNSCITTLNLSGHGGPGTGASFSQHTSLNGAITAQEARSISRYLCANAVVIVHACGYHDSNADRLDLANKLQRRICACDDSIALPYDCNGRFKCVTPTRGVPANAPVYPTEPEKKK